MFYCTSLKQFSYIQFDNNVLIPEGKLIVAVTVIDPTKRKKKKKIYKHITAHFLSKSGLVY